MDNQIKRPIGQILLDGGFLSKNKLDLAFEEQKRTKEPLGHVLVRMGILKTCDLDVLLLVQEHLSNIDDAVKIAAGEHQQLGTLLVQSGRISNKQLDRAITEQKWTKEKLGEVFTRLGMLSEGQLAALLEFQHHQPNPDSFCPIKLGELLIASGVLSHDQLEDALHKQSISQKKIGEVLVQEGYVSTGRIKKGFRLQKMLVGAILGALLSLGMNGPAVASSVSLQWDANTETDLAGYNVYHATDSTPLAGTTPLDVSKQTIATIDNLDPDKSYTFAVTAYNSSGVESSYSNIVTIAEQVAPAVDIITPANAVNVSGTVSISVSASDNVGVTKVEFYVNGVLKATDLGTPYVYSWDTSSIAPGAYTLMAKAYDAAGNVSQSSRTVTVVNDNFAPTVALTAPANNTTINGVVTINSSASDNVGVTKVEFYCNGSILYASNVSPYTFNWDTRGVGNGNYTIIARAYDNAGNSKQSSSVTVTVSNPVPDVTAPAVSSFTLPASATALTVPVSDLTASDAVGVTGYLITESATPPVPGATGWSAAVPTSFTFSAAGSKTAYVWAKDAAGNVSAKRAATVIIDSTKPIVSTFTMPFSAASLTVPVSGFTATDNVSVTGYMITENATPPSFSATGWSSSAPSSFTFSATGTKTAYAWAKDAAGNIGSPVSANVTVRSSVADVSPPAITFISPSSTFISGSTLNVRASATDNTAVTNMQLYIDGILQLSTNTSLLISSVNISTGEHVIMVTAHDANNNVTSSSIKVFRYF